MLDNRRLGWALAALGMLAVSTDSLFVRLAEVGAIDMAFLVSAFSLPVFLTLAIATGRSGAGGVEPVASPVEASMVGRALRSLHRPVQLLDRVADTEGPRRSIREAALPLLGVASLSAISQVSFITAITRTSVVNVVVIVAAAPVVAAVVARVVLGERTSARVWLAMIITGSGIGIVVAPSVGGPSLDGDLLALLAIVAFALNLALWRRHPDLSRYVGLAIGASLVLVVTGPFVSPADLEPRGLAAAGAMGLLFSPVGRIAHSSAPKFAPAAEVALFAPVETVAATVWAWIAFAEVPPVASIIGGFVIVAGVFYGTFGR